MPAAETVEILIREYYKLVFHTIYGLTNNWEESQDLTQDTFHQALKGIDAARASSGSHFQAKAWLLRIALNTVRMQRRRRALFSFIPFSSMNERLQSEGKNETKPDEEALHERAVPVQPIGYGTAGADDPAELVAEQDAVQRTMAKLPESLRVCLLLSIIGGLSTAEIARTLDVKEAAIRQRLARARKQFQEIYTQDAGEESVNSQSDDVEASDGAQEREHRQPERHQRLTLATRSPALGSGYV